MNTKLETLIAKIRRQATVTAVNTVDGEVQVRCEDGAQEIWESEWFQAEIDTCGDMLRFGICGVDFEPAQAFNDFAFSAINFTLNKK